MSRLSSTLLSSFPLLSFALIKEFSTSTLLWKKGYALVSCGDVWDLISVPDGECLIIKGWVHSEKSSAILYSISVMILPSHMCTNFTCVCTAYSHLPSSTAAQCKHIFALLGACEAICNFSDSVDPPPQFYHPGMHVYGSAPQSVQVKVELDLTWNAILGRSTLCSSPSILPLSGVVFAQEPMDIDHPTNGKRGS